MGNVNVEHRKSAQKLQFVDKQGNKLAKAEVSMKLMNHEFLFGSGAFDSLPATALDDEKNPNPEKAFYQDRVDKWEKLFNFGTLPFYWGGFEPVEGQPETESRMAAAKYLQSKGKTLKGHPLCWHTVCADWLMEYDNKTILQKQLDRINRDVTKFRGVIDMWDVINEVVIMPVFDRYDNAVTRICKDLGRVRLVKEVFDAAKAANPDAVLLINDFNLSESYRILIDGCLNAGVPISAIGLQTHQHQGYMGREKLEDVIERFSVFGLPLHFTENTLVSGHIMPPHIVDLNDYVVDEWPSTPEGEERQRQEWREMYEILFSHPEVAALTGWDFADGAWLKAPSGIIHADNTLKPVYHEIDKLEHEVWHTEGVIHTDENGVAVLEGFRGTYDLTVNGKKIEYKLVKNQAEEVVRIVVE